MKRYVVVRVSPAVERNAGQPGEAKSERTEHVFDVGLTRRRRAGTLLCRVAKPDRLSGTVTFLFTDIEGSTTLLKLLGRERYGDLLPEQQRLLREAFAAHGGEEIDTQGDSFFIAFRSASNALSAAAAAQRALAAYDWPDGSEVRPRHGCGRADR